MPGLRVIWIRFTVYCTRLQVLSAGRARFINKFLLEGPHRRRKMLEKWMREGTVHRETDSKYAEPATLGIHENPSPEPFFNSAAALARGPSWRNVLELHQPQQEQLKKIRQKSRKTLPLTIKLRTGDKPLRKNNDDNVWPQLKHPIRRRKQRQQRINQRQQFQQ